MSLIFADQGREYQIISLLGGRGFYKRLYEMGIRPGSVIKVIINQGNGPVIIGVNNLRLGIGKGMAAKIIIRPMDRKESHL